MSSQNMCYNSKLKLIALPSRPAIANTPVMRRPTSVHRKLLYSNQQLSIKVQQQKQAEKIKITIQLYIRPLGSLYEFMLSSLVNQLLSVHRKLPNNNQRF